VVAKNSSYVYGASLFGQALADFLSSLGTPPKAIIDANPKKKSHNGIPIENFSSADFDYSLPVFITILGYDGVETSIYSRGFQHVYDTYSVFSMFPGALSVLNRCGFLWMQEPRCSQWDDGLTYRLESVLSDQKSVELLRKIISYRKSPCLDNYPVPESYPMYTPIDVPLLYESDSLRVLDVGAYDGDTYRTMREKFPQKILSYCAIEASPKNVESLRKTIAEQPLASCEVKVVYGAVGLPAGKKLFIHENKSASTVEVIDDNLPNMSVLSGSLVPNVDLSELSLSDYNFVKMDIEGADFSALECMRYYISKCRPNMALSVYHNPDDLWKIPLFLFDISNDGYYFYLRQEGHWLFETQLYAVRK
jgi:FkbM family methyltransferase